MRVRQEGFTLIELLIVIGIVAVLATVAVLVINPAELFARTRDTARLNELQSINRGIQFADLYGVSEGAAQTVYLSLPDSSPTCASYVLPTLTVGWTYACSSSANYRKADGAGWIPVNFASTGVGIFTVLPIDPVNTLANNYYYTYTPGGSWVLTAALESAQQLAEAAVRDNGTDDTRFEVGTDIALWNQSRSSPPAPSISSVSPNSGSRRATLTVTVDGASFTSDAVISLSGTRITVNSTTFVNSVQATANISIESNAQKTARDVIVTTAAGSGICTGCFTVTN